MDKITSGIVQNFGFTPILPKKLQYPHFYLIGKLLAFLPFLLPPTFIVLFCHKSMTRSAKYEVSCQFAILTDPQF